MELCKEKWGNKKLPAMAEIYKSKAEMSYDHS